MVAIGIVLLYFLPFFSGDTLGQAFIVSTPVLVLAVLTAVLSAGTYFWIPKNMLLQTALAGYLSLAVTAGALIVTTGGIASPFIALWMLVAVFAGIFSVWGLLPMVAAIGVFVGAEYLNDNFGTELLVVVAFAGVLPLVASFILWHAKGKAVNDSGDRAYKDLASELSQVASQSEVVINAIGDGVMAIDNKGVIQLINPAAQRMLGWGKQDAFALSYRSVLQLINSKGEALEANADPVEQVLNTNQQMRDNDLTALTNSGKKIMVSLVVSPVGELGSGAIIVFRDITKEKAEEREQAEFISTASHEMRTPVASIEGYLGLALNPNTAQIDDKARDFILKAHEAAKHLGRLFQDLLDVSKSEDGRLTNSPKVVDIMAYTREIIGGLEEKANEKGLRLTFKPNPKDGEKHVVPVYNVNLDNDHIREIIDNLTENAIKYTPQGEVIVDVTGNEDKVIISIKDSGIGIPVEDIPHLFQKFYRVNNTETNQIGGTGLGLYLCRRLAEAMNGRIWVESEYQKGSTFFLELPRISAQDAIHLKEEQARAEEQAARLAATQPAPVAESVPVAASPDVTSESPAPTSDATQAATTVPRGESLTREQIAAHVAKLQAMVKEQQATPAPAATEPSEPAPATDRPANVSIPVRDTPAPRV